MSALDYKFGYIYTLNRSFSSVFDLCKLYFRVSTSKKSLFENDCSKYFTNKCPVILKGVFQIEIPVQVYQEKRASLPFLGKGF